MLAKTNVAVVDLGTGNLRSVAKAITHVSGKAQVKVTASAQDVDAASHVVLPGQGAIGTWMKMLEQNIELALSLERAMNKKPVLGICLGLQALFAHSDEDAGTNCLNKLPGRVKRFSATRKNLKIPHMGWNQVKQKSAHTLWSGIADNARFYFAHSYYADSAEDQNTVGVCEYGTPFTAAAAKNNLFAVQFHPEKSASDGLKLMQNFLHWQDN